MVTGKSDVLREKSQCTIGQYKHLNLFLVTQWHISNTHQLTINPVCILWLSYLCTNF